MNDRICCRCGHHTHRPVLIAVPFADSGPGGPASYACLPCARVYARSPLAPEWLTEEIHNAEAQTP